MRLVAFWFDNLKAPVRRDPAGTAGCALVKSPPFHPPWLHDTIQPFTRSHKSRRGAAMVLPFCLYQRDHHTPKPHVVLKGSVTGVSLS